MPDEPPLDPDDADLIAYLDGELTGEDARAVESRMTLDPEAREKADGFRKTFDLLNYLPKSEPSPDFTARTLTKLQPTVGDTASQPSAPVPSAAATARIDTPRRRDWWSNLAWIVVAVVALGGGYFAHAGLRPYVDSRNRAVENLPLSDLRVIEHLPLYLGVDDLEFVRELDTVDFFGIESGTVAFEPIPSVLTRPDPSVEHREKLIALFVSYPPLRQQQLRQLDQQLGELPHGERERLFRVLEQYAIWLDRLPTADRKEVLGAPTAAERLEQIRQSRERQWRDSLPIPAREQLKLVANPEERLRLVAKWKQAEQARHEEWALARRQWETLNRNPNAKPWPFSDPTLPGQVDEFIRTVLRADLTMKLDPKAELPVACRLTRDEFLELKLRQEATTRDGYWLLYGACVLKMAERHPGLPEPVGKSPLTDLTQFPADVLKDLKFRKLGQEIRKNHLRGKWPDFALEVAIAAQRTGMAFPEPIGPCRPGQFSPAIEKFLGESLEPALSKLERESLKKLEGKWPEYPRQMMELARKHDRVVPGVSLPGQPSLWAKYYGTQPMKP